MLVPLSSSSNSQMELEEVSVSTLEVDHEDMKTPASFEEERGVPSSLCFSCESICAFSRREHNILEAEERLKSKGRLCSLIFFYLLIMSVEIVGGLKANSLAVITDAAHLLTDVAGFAISLFAIWVSSREANARNSFGYSRLEVLGALLSIQLIWLISGILIYEATERLLNKTSEVNGEVMFAIAAFGFLLNLVMVIWLGHDHAHHHTCGHKHRGNEHDEENANLLTSSGHNSKTMNINLQGAYLHVMADMIQSFGVMIGGAIIWAKPDWLLIDLICTFVFSAFALSATLPMLKNIFRILMESAPSEIDIARLERDLKCIKGVQNVHDLHVWAITVGKTVLSCHVIAEPGLSSTEIVCRMRDFCQKEYRIYHVTIQVEFE